MVLPRALAGPTCGCPIIQSLHALELARYPVLQPSCTLERCLVRYGTVQYNGINAVTPKRRVSESVRLNRFLSFLFSPGQSIDRRNDTMVVLVPFERLSADASSMPNVTPVQDTEKELARPLRKSALQEMIGFVLWAIIG